MRSLAAPLALLALLPSCVISLGDWNRATRDASYDIETDGVTQVRVVTQNGRITVAPASPGESSFHAEARFRASAIEMEEAIERVNRMHLQLDREGDTLYVSVHTDEDNRRWSAQLDLVVPNGVALDLRSSNSAVVVHGDYPSVVVDTSNGEIDARCSRGGSATLSSSNGAVTLRGAPDTFQAYTSNGGVIVELEGDWSGQGIARTSNGGIRVDATGTIHAAVSTSTSNGKVHSNVSKHRGSSVGSLRLETSNGGIHVREQS